ncbi:protein FLX-like 2 [Phalaenopsis equestris]|uniref:protein FLX-like 2 n=1 Tax=Phalaenopsis equestris TaxID=78828 RepID=UPI0009E65416|nr:protein FLX-like 2 [Phalaenopsis equestris]
MVSMGSNGRMPLNMRRALPGPGMFHPEPFGPGVRPPLGALPHVLPPDVIEQKLAAQHMEMQTLASENQRLAATHSALRHELAAAQHELQRLQTHMSAGKFEHEQKMMAMLDTFAKMEADIRAAEPLKVELQQAHAEAQSLFAARQELISKVQELTLDLQKSHGDAQQIPSLISELDVLRKEYQHCSDTYDNERKLRIDHHESLQVMEKNYVSMLGEVEKLQRELVNAAHADKTGGSYGSNVGYKENESSRQHAVVQNAYEDGYRAPQEHGPAGTAAQFGGAPVRAAPAPRSGYEVARNTGYDAPRNMGYDKSAAPHFETSRPPSYDPPRGLNYDAARGPGYEAHSMTGGAQGAAATANPVPHMNAQMQTPYGSAQAPAAYGTHLQATYGTQQVSNRPTGGYEAPARGAAPGGGGYEAPARGAAPGGGGGTQGHR